MAGPQKAPLRHSLPGGAGLTPDPRLAGAVRHRAADSPRPSALRQSERAAAQGAAACHPSYEPNSPPAAAGFGSFCIGSRQDRVGGAAKSRFYSTPTNKRRRLPQCGRIPAAAGMQLPPFMDLTQYLPLLPGKSSFDAIRRQKLMLTAPTRQICRLSRTVRQSRFFCSSLSSGTRRIPYGLRLMRPAGSFRASRSGAYSPPSRRLPAAAGDRDGAKLQKDATNPCLQTYPR